MKTIFSTIIAVLSVSSVFSQKIAVNETDKFTGSKLVETSVLKTSRPNVDYKICNINDTLYIASAIKNLKVTIDESTQAKIYIITSDGKHVDLDGVIQNSESKEHHSGIHWGYGITTGTTKQLSDVKLAFLIPDQHFATLCDSQITDIRISVGNKSLDYEVDEFMAKKFNKLFNLMK